MQIAVEKIDKGCVLKVAGRMDAASVAGFDAEFNKQIAEGVKVFVLDLADLEYISSAGLRSILAAGKKTKIQQGKIVLCSLKAMVREVFEISGFSSLFSIFDSRDAAVAQL